MRLFDWIFALGLFIAEKTVTKDFIWIGNAIICFRILFAWWEKLETEKAMNLTEF